MLYVAQGPSISLPILPPGGRRNIQVLWEGKCYETNLSKVYKGIDTTAGDNEPEEVAVKLSKKSDAAEGVQRLEMVGTHGNAWCKMILNAYVINTFLYYKYIYVSKWLAYM
jgi:hypothetical protein